MPEFILIVKSEAGIKMPTAEEISEAQRSLPAGLEGLKDSMSALGEIAEYCAKSYAKGVADKNVEETRKAVNQSKSYAQEVSKVADNIIFAGSNVLKLMEGQVDIR